MGRVSSRLISERRLEKKKEKKRKIGQSSGIPEERKTNTTKLHYCWSGLLSGAFGSMLNEPPTWLMRATDPRQIAYLFRALTGSTIKITKRSRLTARGLQACSLRFPPSEKRPASAGAGKASDAMCNVGFLKPILQDR